MRKISIVVLVTILGIGLISAQKRQLLYDFYETPQALSLNPGAKTLYQWHVGVPLISGLFVEAGTSGITVNDLFANDGLNFTDKVRDNAINSLSERDEFGGSAQIEVFNVGYRKNDNYYSFGVYGEGFIAQYWPKDLAILAFEGNANNLNRRFDFSDITTQGEAVSVFHFGINKKVNDDLSIGFRGKVYSSIFEFKSVNNSGYFETTQGENNILRNTIVADVQLRTSGIEGFLDILEDSSISARKEFSRLLLSRSFLKGNLGLGFDVGFTKQLNQNIVITGSLLDVGFIYHTKDIKNYTLEGSVSNEGVEILLPEAISDFNNDIWQNLIDDIEAQVPFQTNEDSYLSLRPIKLNASIRYNFGQGSLQNQDCYCGTSSKYRNNGVFDYTNALGAQLYVINRPKGPQAAITAFFQKRIGKVLAFKATYTADKFSYENIGLGLNLQAGPVNFYILGDNLLEYRNIADSNYASLQFGFNIISWNSN